MPAQADTALLVRERHHRLEGCRAARRQDAREDRGGEEHDGRRGEGHRVGRLKFEELAAQVTGEAEGGDRRAIAK